jgi:hypothetical protein
MLEVSQPATNFDFFKYIRNQGCESIDVVLLLVPGVVPIAAPGVLSSVLPLSPG